MASISTVLLYCVLFLLSSVCILEMYLSVSLVEIPYKIHNYKKRIQIPCNSRYRKKGTNLYMVFHDGLSCAFPMIIVRYMHMVYHYFLFSFDLLMFILE